MTTNLIDAIFDVFANEGIELINIEKNDINCNYCNYEIGLSYIEEIKYLQIKIGYFVLPTDFRNASHYIFPFNYDYTLKKILEKIKFVLDTNSSNKINSNSVGNNIDKKFIKIRCVCRNPNHFIVMINQADEQYDYAYMTYDENEQCVKHSNYLPRYHKYENIDLSTCLNKHKCFSILYEL